MDDYFSNMMVRNVSSNIGLTPMTSDSIVTNDRITTYDQLYRISRDGLNYQTTASAIIPFSQGFGTPEEPLIINAATEAAELAAFNAALTAVYGQEAGDIDAYQVPPTFERTGFTPAPS